MNENFESPRQEIKTSEVMLEQQNMIRETVEARTEDVPMAESEAAREIEEFGLDAGMYDVYDDTEKVHFGGGFKKFVSKEDPSEVLHGLTWPHVGGPMHDLNHYLNNVVLRPNGDIVGKLSKENAAEGQIYENIFHSASSTDPDKQRSYERWLKNVSDHTRALTEKSHEAQGPNVAEASPVWKTRKRLLGRFSLRRP